MYDHFFEDALIDIECFDGLLPFYCKREALKETEFFMGLFRMSRPEALFLENHYINHYKIKIDFALDIVQNCLKMLLEECEPECTNFLELLECSSYFMMKDRFKKGIIGKIVQPMEKEVSDPDSNFQLCQGLLNSDAITNKQKKNFLARHISLFNEEHQQELKTAYREIIPERYYRPGVHYEDKKISIGHTISFSYFEKQGAKFKIGDVDLYTSLTEAIQTHDSWGFWINCKKKNDFQRIKFRCKFYLFALIDDSFEKVIQLKVNDDADIIDNDQTILYFPKESEDSLVGSTKYRVGQILDYDIDDFQVCQFEIELL